VDAVDGLGGHPARSWDDLVLFLGGGPGSFTGMLLTLIAQADPANRARLRCGFPRQVAAWEAWAKHRPATFADLSALLDEAAEADEGYRATEKRRPALQEDCGAAVF
jgi:hypothetical protein